MNLVTIFVKMRIVYINEGKPYSKEYRQLIQKEIGKDKLSYPVMEVFLKKGLFENASPQIKNSI